MKGYERILIISDTHEPFSHPDALRFLRAASKEYEPDKVIHVGDEVDAAAISFHDHDPDLPSPGDELQLALDKLKRYYQVFPEVAVLESNHGSRLYRRAMKYGIPKAYLKDYGQFLGSPPGWKWHTKLLVPMSDGSQVLLAHGVSSVPAKWSRSQALSTVEGHWHSKFEIVHWANPVEQFFAMKVGSLLDDSSRAFAYNKLSLDRPILGCGLILNGQPRLLPMRLTKSGRWNRRVTPLRDWRV